MVGCCHLAGLWYRHQNVAALADLMPHPAGETAPDVDAVVAEQPINLLDRVLGNQAPGLRQGLANHRHCQRRRLHHAERGTRQ
jgi:hypothetical protein